VQQPPPFPPDGGEAAAPELPLDVCTVEVVVVT